MNYNTPEVLRKMINFVLTHLDDDFPKMEKEDSKIMYSWDGPEKYSKENDTYLIITCLSLNTKYSMSIAAYSKTYGYQCSQIFGIGSKQEIVDKLKDDDFVVGLIPQIEKLHESLDESMDNIRR